ncbi:MAG: ankyrin repeat domain-containing protein [Planctomycetes bacterium]|nr:ankyrin repeat domain-containing protein [Planctomycetota bacterium]
MNDIHKATERGKFDLVKEILDSDPTQVHARTTGLPPGDQPLHLAAWQGRKKIAEYLLDAGADINSRGESGRTPLHYAFEGPSQAIIKLLIERGADLNARMDVGCTALYLAASVGDEKITRLLLKAGAEKDLNSRIHIDGADEVIKSLQANPALLDNAVRPATLLEDAIRVESPTLAEFLLAHGVSPNTGWTGIAPLYQAMGIRHVELVRTLLANGADTSVRDITECCG